MRNRRNFYRVLQVQPDAPYESVKASYRTLMQKLKAHPDLGGDEWNAAVINEAYAVIGNPQKRAKYDAGQMGLRNAVGADARADTRASAEPGATPAEPEEFEAENNDSADLDLDSPPPPPQSQTNDPLVCAFCCTRNASGDYQAPDEVSRGCGGPMRLVENCNASERASRRIERQSVIHFRVDAARTGSYPANVVDLSPTGLRFVSKHRLRCGAIVKLDSPTLSALASVTHSGATPARGQFPTGVRFLTLKLIKTRGTFVSAST